MNRAALTALSLLAAACGEVVGGSSNDGGDANDAGPMGDGGERSDAAPAGRCMQDSIAFEDLRGCRIASQCAFVLRCGLFRVYPEECPIVLEHTDEDFDLLIDGVEAGRIEFDGEAAAECLGSFYAGAESCYIGPSEVCDRVFVGTVLPTDPCFLDEECAGNGSQCNASACDDDMQCCIGTCASSNATNELCGSDAPCMDGDHCVFDNTDTRCYPGDAGSFCGGSDDCDSSFYCLENECTARKAPGRACTDNDECAAPTSCVGEDIGLGTCQPTYRLGDTCDDGCRGPYTCRKDGGPTGVCSLRVPQGGRCESSTECEGSDLCSDEGFCVPRTKAGQACDPFECEIGLICSSELPGGPAAGNCIEPRASGMSCDSDDQCQSGRCNESTTPGVCEDYENCYQ